MPANSATVSDGDTPQFSRHSRRRRGRSRASKRSGSVASRTSRRSRESMPKCRRKCVLTISLMAMMSGRRGSQYWRRSSARNDRWAGSKALHTRRSRRTAGLRYFKRLCSAVAA